jgi:hypothetical protein
MKRNYTLYILSILLIIGASSCNKNQRKVNIIEGNWSVDVATLGDVGTIYSGDMIFNFESCKLKKNGYCEFTYEDWWNGDYVSGVYNVTHNGEQLNMTFHYPNGDQPYSFEIKKLNDNRVVLQNIDAETGTFDRLELRAIE